MRSLSAEPTSQPKPPRSVGGVLDFTKNTAKVLCVVRARVVVCVCARACVIFNFFSLATRSLLAGQAPPKNSWSSRTRVLATQHSSPELCPHDEVAEAGLNLPLVGLNQLAMATCLTPQPATLCHQNAGR